MKKFLLIFIGCCSLLSARSQECDSALGTVWWLLKEKKTDAAFAFLSLKLTQEIDVQDRVHYLYTRACLGINYKSDMEILEELCLSNHLADKEMWDWYMYSFLLAKDPNNQIYQVPFYPPDGL